MSLFGAKTERLCISDLFHKFSYRYNVDWQGSFLNPFRYLKWSLSTLYKVNDRAGRESGDFFVYEEKEQFRKEDIEYLGALGIRNVQFIFRHGMANSLSLPRRLYCTIEILLLFPFICIAAWFSVDKAKLSLVVLELVELELLADFLKKKNSKQLMIISAFEKDIAFMSYYLQKVHGVKISLLPSANPISLFYKVVVCDTFIFTAPFQEVEYQLLKQNWIVNHVKTWPPYGFTKVQLNDKMRRQGRVLGFGCSGMALREHLQHPKGLPNLTESEHVLVDCLRRLLKEVPTIQLMVFLHPLEKANKENLEFSLAYHRRMFGPSVQFSPLDRATYECLDLADVTVAGFSSSQFHRLYGGFKTIFAPMGFLQGYFADPAIVKVSADNYEQLKDLVVKSLDMGDKEFFERYGLEKYRWTAFTKVEAQKL